MKHILFASMLFAAVKPEGGDTGGGAEAPAPKPEKPAREKKNGVTKPSVGTQTGKVWEIASSISEKKGSPAERAEVLEAAKEFDINPATVTTQYGQWRKFHGIVKVAKPAKAAAAAPAAAAPTTGVSGAESQNPGVIDGGSSVEG